MKILIANNLCLLFALFCFNFTLHSQESKSWKFGTGVGFIDGVHISISHAISKYNEFGFQIGTISYSSINITALEYKFYLEESKKRENFMTWYVGNKLLYYYEKNRSRDFNELYINTSVGKSFYLSPRFGINTDLGILYQLYEKQVNSYEDENNRFRILPSLRLQLYYSF